MVSPLNRKLIVSIISLVFSSQFSAVSCNAQNSQSVRVLILQDAVSLNLKINGHYEIIDSSNQEVLASNKNLKTTVTTYKDGILMGGMNFNTSRVFIKTKDEEIIIIDGRRFRGDIQFIKKDNLRLSVINYVDLGDYVKGILYHEVSHYWPPEALKAQAIVSSTYALYQMQENKSRDYDVTSDIYSQVYGGRTSERYRTNKVVDQTQGKILTYQGKLFPAYYHATCAGHTEDASLLWNIDIPPLKGVLCIFCKDSPHFNWHRVLSLDEIKDKLVNAGYKIDNIKDVVILEKNKSGRISNLLIETDKSSIKISAKDFRNAIGPNLIRSTNFTVSVENLDAVFEGFGWGHGVGMCQWGAYFMAKQGYKFDEILKHYYPETEIALDETVGF